MPASNVVVGFHPKSFRALSLSVMSISTSLGRSLPSSTTTFLSSLYVSFFIKSKIASIFHVLQVPMLIISPSMLGVWRALVIAFVVSSMYVKSRLVFRFPTLIPGSFMHCRIISGMK